MVSIKKIGLIVAGVIVILVVVGVIIYPRKPIEIAIGESIKKNDVVLITFTGTKFAEEVKVDGNLWKSKEGCIFFIIYVTFENTGNKDLSYAELTLPIFRTKYFDAILIANGYEFDIRGTAFPIYEIKIRETIDTYIFFEIPKNLEPTELDIKEPIKGIVKL